jgi:hypothetical protein
MQLMQQDEPYISRPIERGSQLNLPHPVENKAAHPMMQTSDLPVATRIITFTFSIIAWLLHVVDTFFQWRTVHEKSKKYLKMKVPLLMTVIAVEIFLIAYIECDIKSERTTWLPALWALICSSMLLSLAVEARLSNHLQGRIADQLLGHGRYEGAPSL